MDLKDIKAIDTRYSELAGSDCCLSCGGAITYAEPQICEICVDLGSGRGNDVLRMAEKVGESGFVYGLDIAEGMLEKAQKSAAKFGVTNVKFIRCELEKLDLPNGIIDLVISNCTINHASDKEAVWNEIYRILKKEGRFVVSDIYATKPIADEYRNDPQAVAECWAGAITRTEYFQILESAGFNSIKVLEESKPYAKGQAEVVSFTLTGKKSLGCGCNA